MIRLLMELNPASDEHAGEKVIGLFVGPMCVIGVGYINYKHIRGGAVFLIVFNCMFGLDFGRWPED